jgi:hypothetical protein
MLVFRIYELSALIQYREISAVTVNVREGYPWRPAGLWDVEAPTFSTQSAYRKQLGCQPWAQVVLYSQEDPWFSLLLEAESILGP